MSKAYVIVTLMICMSFTGCIEDDEEEDSATLKDSAYEFFDWGNTQNWRKWCSYILYKVEDNKIILATSTELNECVAEIENDSGVEYKYNITDYIEENLDYRAADNSGFVYSVSVAIELCKRSDEFEPWDCDNPSDWGVAWPMTSTIPYKLNRYNSQSIIQTLWVEVDGQWVWWDWSPTATFFVEKGSDGIYYVDVIEVNRDDVDLTDCSFSLKDDTGSILNIINPSSKGRTWGEIAIQVLDGWVTGIDMSYEGECTACGSNKQVLNMFAANITNDNGTNWPVHFSDNDRDGKLSVEDQFLVYNRSAWFDGPVEEGWRLDIQFDLENSSDYGELNHPLAGDIIGSATMT